MKAYLRNKKDAKCYYCILTWSEGGKRKSKELSTGIPIKGNNKRKAEQRMEEIRKEYEEKIELQKIIPFQKMTFDEYMEAWLRRSEKSLKPTTYYNYSNVVNNHIVPYFREQGISLSELLPQHIQSYYDYLTDKGLSASTVKKHHANIRKALQEALKQNAIPYNMADRTTLPALKKYEPQIYNAKQLKTLIEVSMGTPLESVIIICSHYALRRGEVCGLKWEDIDLEGRIIHIRSTRTTANTELYQESTKTESSTRELPIDDNMYTYLIKLKRKQDKDKLFFGKCYQEEGFVCRWEDGKPLAVSYVSHAFTDLLEKNGLPPIRFHDIRHSVATSLLANDIDLKIIQVYLGHSTMSTTANYYLHPNMSQKAKATNVMSDLLRTAM